MNTNTYTIGIIGFGRFGQFLGKNLVKNFKVLATSRKNYSNIANNNNIKWFNNLEEFFTNKIDIIILSTSILSFETIIKKISNYNLKNKLILDVCSVKEHPKEIMLKYLKDSSIDILCTHPMFGPDSGKISWKNLPFVYEKIRIINNDRLILLLNFFKEKGCLMINISSEEHDKLVAKSQFITHFTGRFLSKLDLKYDKINTVGFNNLLEVINNTNNDSFDLFKGLYEYNKYSEIELLNIKKKFDDLYKKLKN